VDERAPPIDTEAMGVASHLGAVRGLFGAGLDALKTRLDLAAVEIELYLLRLVQMLLWALAAVACGLLALVFGLVSIVAALWDTHRMAGLLGSTALFLILAIIFGSLGARSFRNRPAMLDGTLQQLDHDQRNARGTS